MLHSQIYDINSKRNISDSYVNPVAMIIGILESICQLQRYFNSWILNCSLRLLVMYVRWCSRI